MADNPNTTAAAQPQASEGAPTPTASPTTQAAPAPVAGPIDIDRFLDQLGAPEVVEAQTTSEAVNPTPEQPATETEGEPADPAADPEETEADPDEQADTEALTKAKDDKVPKWVPERLAKNAEQKRELKAKLSEAQSRAEAAEAKLAEATANVQAPLPPSPLAYLDTPEKLAEEVQKAADYLAWADSPEAVNSYKDDEQTTAEEKLALDRRRALFVIKHQPEHAKILAARAEAQAAVKKAAPELFDGKSAAAQERARLYQADPRTLPDWDQIIADAIRGRTIRTEEASGKARYQRIDIAAAKANGAAGARAAAAKVNGKTPPIYTPPASASRAPVRAPDAPNPAADVWSRAKQKSVSIDEMEAAGALA